MAGGTGDGRRIFPQASAALFGLRRNRRGILRRSRWGVHAQRPCETPENNSNTERGGETAFVLTLASPTSTYRLGLPTSDDDLEQTKRALRLDDLDSATIRDVEIDYLSSYRRTVFGCTPIIAATSAVLYVVKMFTPHSTYCIASLKSGGKVEGFIIACSYNICNDAGFLLLASKASV